MGYKSYVSDFDFVELAANSTKSALEIDCKIRWNHHFVFFVLRFNLQFQGSQVDKVSIKCPFSVFISLVLKSTADQRNLK